MQSTDFSKILRILSKEGISRRSSLILNLIFNDKIVTSTKGDLLSSKSICTYISDIFRRYHVHPDFVIPDEYLEYPKLYRIYQNNEHGNKNYYKFGPSSRWIHTIYNNGDPNDLMEFVKNNLDKVEFIETWTNSRGKIHRDDGYAITYLMNDKITATRSYINGYQQDTNNGFVARIDKYQIGKVNLFNGLIAEKEHIYNGLHEGHTRYFLKPRVVSILDGLLIFFFNNDEDDNEVFKITNDVNVLKKVSPEKVIEMIEDFGNSDSEGNDMSDRFIRDYIMTVQEV